MWAIDAVAKTHAANVAAKSAQQTADKNTTLDTHIYDLNTANATPFMRRGDTAGGTINAFLGQGGDVAGARDSFNTFLSNSAHDVDQNNGFNAITQNKAVGGMLHSGSTLKGLQEFKTGNDQKYANSFLNFLGNQQQVGLGAVNGLAGVGTTYANQVNANNNNASDAYGNAALLKGNALGGAFNNLISGLSGALGSSYR